MAKRNIWKDPSPYGTYEGERGNPEQWRNFFNIAWDKPTAEKILKEDSPWDILGIIKNATLNLIKKAFRELMKIHHPDKGGDIERAKKIIAAYVYLTGK